MGAQTWLRHTFAHLKLEPLDVLKAFNVVFHKAVALVEACEDVTTRVKMLIDCVTYSTFNYISMGLFERDKLTFAAQLAFQVCVCVCAFVSERGSLLTVIRLSPVAPDDEGDRGA